MNDRWYGAEIERRFADIMRGPGVRLHIYQRVPGGTELLMGPGTWQRVDEAVQAPDDAGLLLPEEALVPLATTLAHHLGNALPSQAEVAVLREVLAKEQQRVDNVLERRWG